MNNNEQEIRSEQPFDSQACVETTMAAFLPQIETAIQGKFYLPSLGTIVDFRDPERNESVESRYASHPGYVIVDVFNKLKAEIEERKASGWTGSITEALLTRELSVNEMKFENLGRSVVNYAIQSGIKVNDMNSQLIKFLIPDFESNMDDALKNKTFNWRIMVGSSHSEKRRVFLVVEQDKANGNYQVVDMDDLYEKSPDYIKNFIVNYHFSQTMTRLLTEIRDNLSIHDLPPQVIPEFIKLVDTTSITIAEEIRDIEYFLRSYEDSKEFPAFLSQRLEIADGKYISLKNYLQHLNQCKGVSDQQKPTIATWLNIVTRIESKPANSSTVAQDLMNQNLELRQLLDSPYTNTKEWLEAKKIQYEVELTKPPVTPFSRESLQEQLDEVNNRLNSKNRYRIQEFIGISAERFDEIAKIISANNQKNNDIVFNTIIRLTYLAKKGIFNVNSGIIRRYIEETYPPLVNNLELIAPV